MKIHKKFYRNHRALTLDELEYSTFGSQYFTVFHGLNIAFLAVNLHSKFQTGSHDCKTSCQDCLIN